MRHEDRPVQTEGVEVAAVRYKTRSQIAPAGSPYPRCLGLTGRVLSQTSAERLDRGGPGQIRPAWLQRGDRQVMVGVDEAGTQDASGEVLDDRVREGLD